MFPYTTGKAPLLDTHTHTRSHNQRHTDTQTDTHTHPYTHRGLMSYQEQNLALGPARGWTFALEGFDKRVLGPLNVFGLGFRVSYRGIRAL